MAICAAFSADIFYESVFAVLNRKSDSFQCDGITNSTHFLYSYAAMHALCIYPYYPSVGHCIVYYRKVLSEPLFNKREINSTLSFLLIHRIGVDTVINLEIINFKIILL